MPASPIPGDPGTPGTSGTSRGDACPGALRLHAADDGFLARVRIPGGVLDVAGARALGDAARRLGDGTLHLTSRGNVQVRGLREGCGPELAEVLGAAGLLPSAAHERVRNVVASPMSGLDGGGFVDVRGWLTGLDAGLCASSVTPGLSGRFLFALDDGRGDVAGLGPDVLLRGVRGGGAVLCVGGAEFRVRYGDAARAAVLAAEVFVRAARGVAGRRVWRVAELGLPGAELARLVAARLAESGVEVSPLRGAGGASASAGVEVSPLRGAGGASASAGVEVSPLRGAGNCATSHDVGALGDESATGAGAEATGLRPGPRSSIAGGAEFSGPGAFARALRVTAPLGSINGTQWAVLTDLAARLPPRELRLTPWRDIVVPGATPADAEGLDRAGLVTDPASPWARTGACIGRPGCAKSHADVRADAEARHPHLPTYWSGCERRCGHPIGPYVDVVARPDGTYAVTEPPA